MSTGWTDFTQKVTDEYSLANLVQTATVALGTGKSFTLSPKRSYAGLLVCTAQPSAATITCSVVTGTGVLPHYALQQVATVANQTLSWWIPIPLDPQIAYLVHLASSVSQATPGAVYVYGVGALPPGLSIRADGRPVPMGTYIVRGASGAKGRLQIIAAPPSPQRLMISWCSLEGTGGVQLDAGTNILLELRATGVLQANFPSGLVLPIGKTIAISATGTTARSATVVYDVVQ